MAPRFLGKDPDSPEGGSGNDFWLFDDRVVRWTHFTGEGEMSADGWETTEDPAAVKTCAAAFGLVWERAIPHEDYRPA